MAPAQPSILRGQAPKRVRISEPEVEVVEDPSKKLETAPSQAARSRVEAAVAPYPEAIQLIALSASKAYNRLKSKIRTQEKTIKRFDDDQEIPGSAKLNFKLTASPDIMEMDEFKQQAALMETAVADFQQTAKKAIKSVAELRLANDRKAVLETLFETLHRLSELLLLENNPDSKDHPVAKFAWFVAGKMDVQIFEGCDTMRDHVRNEIKRNIDDDNNMETGTDVLTFERGENDRFADLQTRISPILHSIFVDSWNAQIDTYRKADIDRTLSKKAKELLLGKEAEEDQMEIDIEPSVAPEKMKALIAEAVKKENKKQQLEIQKLRETVKRSKNSNRGAQNPTSTKGGAPSTKKNGDQKQEREKKGHRSPAKEKGTGDSRARNDNASPKGNRTSQQKKQQEKKKQKEKRSRKPK
jgi:hypothetical protein